MSSGGDGVATARGGAERRLVSILFADLVGFTPFAEERDPEVVRDLLTRYFDTARLAVERHGGAVEKFIGDAVMAVWGTPVAHEDDAERAVRAALAIVDTCRDLGPGIEARAAVVTGEAAVTLGAIGQGMVAGDLVNTASRLQSVAPPGSVLVGEATMHAAEAAVAFEAVGGQQLKGKTSPVSAFRALRVVAERGGQGRVEGIEPPFVGRDDELRLLKDALHGAGRDSRIRLISITGPAGIGKSRLAWELEKYADGVVDRVHWHRGRSPSYGEGIAFWALGEMVRRRAGLAESDDEGTARARIGRIVAEYVTTEADRRWVEPALLALLGLEDPPAGGRDTLFAGWRIFFESVARKGTTVLLFEDLHWADAGLLDFVEHMLDWSKGVPILIVTLARPELFERRPDWAASKPHSTAIALEPLHDAAMRELLGGFVPGLPDETTAAILARADGIPLYAVETVRMLVAGGLLELVGGAYRARGDLTKLSVPETLRSLIGARLDVLDPVVRAVVQDASVLGRTFTTEALSGVSGIAEADLEPRLRALVRRELLELEADPRSPERGQFGFVQSLIREVAYDTLAKPDRRARHLAAARYFEALDEDELAGVLASHYLAAYEAAPEGPEADALAGQTRLALRGAAERAANLGGHEQAVTYLEQALRVATDAADRAELLERAATSANFAARYELAEAHARAAIEAYEAAGDQRAVGRATALLGNILIDAGDLDGAVVELEAGLQRMASATTDGALEALLLTTLSRALFRSGATLKALETADRALDVAEILDLEEIVAEAFINKGATLEHLGRWREAEAVFAAAIRLAQTGGWIASELRARIDLAYPVLYVDPPRALALMRSTLELAERVGNRGFGNWLVHSAGQVAFLIGSEWTAAIESLRETAVLARSPSERSSAVGLLAMFRAARGEPLDELIAEFEAAAKEVSDPQIHADLALVRSEVALILGDLAAAHHEGISAAEGYSSVWTSVGLQAAARAAAWDRDLHLTRATAERLAALAMTGVMLRAHRMLATAYAASLEGLRDAALQAFRQALDVFAGGGLDFEVARTGLDMVLLLGPGEPESRAAAERSRTIFERVGAQAYVDKLEGALGMVHPPKSTTAAESADEAALLRQGATIT